VSVGRTAEARLRVDLPDRPTDVVVGSGCLARFSELVAARLPRARRFHHVWDTHVAAIAGSGRWEVRFVPPKGSTSLVPAGEAAKERPVHLRLEDDFLDAALTRDDAVIAVGGGAALDVAGFAAATVRRGIPWVAVPTSVVAMADAAVGGKTGVNHPRGKNLVGTFHAPALVVADVKTLATLSTRDKTAGLAEVWKAGVVGDPALVDRLDAGPPATDAAWVDTIARALAVKIRLVERDERDLGERRLLNYGHTVGHALEFLGGFKAHRHGEAIAIGMGVAAEVARRRGMVAPDLARAQDDVLSRLGLPVRVPATAITRRVLDAMRMDKKRRPGEPHTFVLPRRVGDAVVAEDVTDEEVSAALDARRES
jgi:3-dehydroquinate synthetase